jgi:hypothetical protein
MIHVDLHETTDSDETEFRPAKAARDGEYIAPDVIPDGFYTVGNAVSFFQLAYIISQQVWAIVLISCLTLITG